ncbi:LysR family transcriptional regulator [Pseudomonas sp. NA-150]|uniref:LysR family transcriptional regulator n=1 Tax=Pseudomonas sp. NA-150 TaxID=3367525 RepID=UPI0037C542AF
MLRLDDLLIFVQTAEAGSFSAAARQMDLTPSLASSCIQRLERELDARLFVRSTRRLRLSEDGERYLPHARSILAAVEGGQHVLAQERREISGTLRLSAPSDFGRNVLAPWLDEFQQSHPGLSLHLRISDQNADFFQQSLDAVIRYGVLADSGLVSLPLAPGNLRTLCAAPAYLERFGTPQTPDDLRQHNCLRYVMGEVTHERWSFQLPDGAQTVTVTGNRVSDDADVVRRWAVAGLGLIYKSRLDVFADLEAGRLVEIFPTTYGEPAPLQLVSSHRTAVTPALQKLREFLQSCCQDRVPAPLV